MSVDPLTALRGAAAGALIAVPAALANIVLSGGDERPPLLSLLTLVGLLAGFGLAGFAAGRLATSDSAPHGFAAAMVVYVLVEVMAVLGRLDRGDGISIGSLLFTGFLAAAAGARGGLAGSRRPQPPVRTA